MPIMCRNVRGCSYLCYVLYVFVCNLYLLDVVYSVTAYPGQPRALCSPSCDFPFVIGIVVELEVRCRGVHIWVMGVVQWYTQICPMGEDLQLIDLC